MNTWFEIKALAKNSRKTTVRIFDEIGAFGITAKDFADQLASVPEDHEITLCISSPGGSVFDGIAIHSCIEAIRDRVTVRIEGLAASMASIIALAGRTVTASENSLVMIHDPMSFAAGNADDLRQHAELLDKIRDQLAAIYVRKTGKTRDEIVTAMGATTWFTAAEARDFGLVDSIFGALPVAACDRSACGAKLDLDRFVPPVPQPEAIVPPPAPPVPPAPDPVAEITAKLEAATRALAEMTEARDQALADLETARAEIASLKATAERAAIVARATVAIGAAVSSGRLRDDQAVRDRWHAAYVADEHGTAELIASLPEPRARGADPVVNSPITVENTGAALLAKYRSIRNDAERLAFFAKHSEALYAAHAAE